MALPEGLPKFSLGYGVMDWATTFLAHPDGDNRGGTWVYTPEQALFVAWFYAVDGQGHFLYRRALLGRPKGWGKSPFIATLACAELLGPTLFAGFGADGLPVGRPEPSPIVQIFALSEAQVENSYEPLRVMLSEGPAYNAYNLDVMKTKVVAPQRGVVEKVTASPRSREGARSTFGIADETHLWLPASGGEDLAKVMRRNLGKLDKRSIETTNAPKMGQRSVAELSYQSAERGQPGLLFDSREGSCEDIYDKPKFFLAVTSAYGDSKWVNKDRLWEEVNDDVNPEWDMRRFYLNERVHGETQWINKTQWENVRDSNLRLSKDDLISLGFRAKNHSAAIVATRVLDGAVFCLGFWEKPLEEAITWEVPYTTVDNKMRKLIEEYNVYNVLASPQNWQPTIGRWSVDYDSVVVEEVWSTNRSRMSKALEQFESAVKTGKIHHSGEQNLTRHVMNSQMEEIPHGYVIRQDTPRSASYIVAAEAAVLSYEGAQVAIEDGALKPKPTGRLYSF